MSTQVHLAVAAQGLPVELQITAGHDHDVTQAARLLAQHEPDDVIADKAYDSDEFLHAIAARKSIAVIPSRRGRTVQRRLLRRHYRRRNLAERFVNRLKHFRRVATR